MFNFEVLQKIPDSYRKSFIADGANGICYRTSYGDVYKEFISGITENNDLEMLTSIDNPYFAFPRILVYLKEKTHAGLTGYRMDYVEGVRFCEIDPNIPIKVLIKASRNIERGILDFTRQYSILIYDLNRDNVLFQDNNEFKIVDTDLYEYYPSEGLYYNLKYNMKQWNEYMLYNLGCALDTFYSNELNLHLEIAINNGKICASNLIKEIIAEVKKQTNGDIKTLNDYNEGIKLIRKRE